MQFIDLCILLGCDYCDSIRGIGPKKAIDYIRKYGTIEQVLANLDKTKYPVPEDWNFQGARELFKNPEVKDPSTIEVRRGICAWACGRVPGGRIQGGASQASASRASASRAALTVPLSASRCAALGAQLKWEAPDEEGLVEFMVKDKGFRYGVRQGDPRSEPFLAPSDDDVCRTALRVCTARTASARRPRSSKRAAARPRRAVWIPSSRSPRARLSRR